MASPVRHRIPTWSAARRPRLKLVPGRRRVAGFAVSLTVLVSAVLMSVALVHTRIAERQLEIDRLERAVRTAQEDFDDLRARRAELRSPTRIAERAAGLGMITGVESRFVPVDPMVLAVTIARTGEAPFESLVGGSGSDLDPLAQFRLVKRVGSEAP